ncbi:MAG: hypothetical protein ACYDAS_04125 [Patescibacteria group bacterium]
MDTDKSQVKITIPSNTKNLLREKATQMGLTISTYVKLLVFADVKDITYPTFFPTKKIEHEVEDAIKLHDQGKLKSFLTVKELDKVVREYED